MRDGKVVDAIWHLSTDRAKHTEENAAKAALESNVSSDGGLSHGVSVRPWRWAAAYAAWLAYKQTGDAEFAVRAGLLTGAVSAGFGKVRKLPNTTAAEITNKTLVAGVIGGVAVAAAGGDEDAIRDGFLGAGGMILVQAGYERYTTHPLDARGFVGEPYCMATLNPKADCAPDISAYELNEKGQIVTDEKWPSQGGYKEDGPAPSTCREMVNGDGQRHSRNR